MLVQHFDDFKSEAKRVPKHIPSKYSAEMSTKSKVVCELVVLHVAFASLFHNFLVYAGASCCTSSQREQTR